MAVTGRHTGWLLFCFVGFFLLRPQQAAPVDCCKVFVCLQPQAQVDCFFLLPARLLFFPSLLAPPDSPVDCFFPSFCRCDRPQRSIVLFLLAAMRGHTVWLLFCFSCLWTWQRCCFLWVHCCFLMLRHRIIVFCCGGIEASVFFCYRCVALLFSVAAALFLDAMAMAQLFLVAAALCHCFLSSNCCFLLSRHCFWLLHCCFMMLTCRKVVFCCCGIEALVFVAAALFLVAGASAWLFLVTAASRCCFMLPQHCFLMPWHRHSCFWLLQH